ncbi:chitin-binding domain protein cbd-1 [Patella vulgata]|uniref:chitin-binding domain protein cbd-1 n=1 Tax=Patella vulgata TaxID=6465 RepID=UPI0021803AB2|nr:chitin-binding domain protein cbd-1 [Patella vulgata]
MRCLLLLTTCFTVTVLGFDCANQDDGIYEIGCKSFVRCKDGEGETVECEEGLVFNPAIGDCDDPSNVASPCGNLIDCSDKPDGHYPDLDQNCHSYYTCQGGEFFGHNFCPDDLVFNEEIGTCDWEINVYEPCGLLPRPPTEKY